MRLLKLALKSLRREWRSTDIRVLLAALIIGVGSVSTTGFLSDRMERALTAKGGEFLGADVVISSPREIEQGTLSAPNMQHSTALEFSSMLATDAGFQLASIRAVDQAFPLRGTVRIAQAMTELGTVQNAMPALGEIYVDPQLLPLLSVEVGDTVELGVAQFKIAGLVKDEPGRAGAVFGISPRVFMRLDEVSRTEILQPGSRVRWLHFFAGTPDQVGEFVEQNKPKLDDTMRMQGGRDGSEAVSGAFQRTERFGKLASLVSLLLAALAVTLAANRYAYRHFDQAALMRCFGMRRHSLRVYYGLQITAIGLLGSGLGVLLGYTAHALLLKLFLPDLSERLPSVHWLPILVAMASGLLALVGAALPSLLRLSHVPPLRVLRRDLSPLTASAWLIRVFSILSFVLLCYSYAGSARMVGSFIVGLLVLVVVIGGIALLTLRVGRWLKGLAPGAWRFGIAQLWRHRMAASIQLGAFALALTLMGIVALVRTDLIDSWRQQLPPDAPNQFLVNISEQQVPQIEQFMQQRDLSITEIYPMVRGRLVGKNGKLFDEILGDEEPRDNSLRRELNLSYGQSLPDNNQITAGQWHGETEQAELSIESGLAERLDVKVGDQLMFTIADREVTATVSSIREVKWDSMQPNFFIIFSAPALKEFPANYIAAFRSPDGDVQTVASFVKQFPTVTVISVDRIIAEVEQLIAQVVLAVELLLGFLLLAGVAVLAAALLASLDERRHEAVVLRTLGASQVFLRRSLLAEFVILGVFAGLLAAIGTEAVSQLISQQLFDLAAKLHPWLWLVSPLFGAVIVTLSGLWMTRKVAKVAPAVALRETA